MYRIAVFLLIFCHSISIERFKPVSHALLLIRIEMRIGVERRFDILMSKAFSNLFGCESKFDQ